MTPPLFSRRPLPVLLAHWVTWILLYALTYLPVLLNASKINWTVFAHDYLVMSSINFILFYLVAFFLIDRIGIQKLRWLWLSIICLGLVVLFTYGKFWLTNYWTEQALQNTSQLPAFFRQRWLKETQSPLGLFSYRFRIYFQTNFYYTFSIVIVAIAYRSALAWYLQEKNRRELENQKLRAELSYLQMQVNPHFLFNALNNIYSLSVIENSKLTGGSILKLSDLLRYMLYEKADEHNKVPLEKEIRHINSYIDLEKMRHFERIYFNFSIEGEIRNKQIAPLLLFPLVENAFKHGVLNDPGNPVTLRLNVTDQQLHFCLENFKNNHLKDKVGGIGVPNVKKRLSLIYGNQFTFSETQNGETYKVKIQLPL
ncbi:MULTISPECIES: sensor histidine kinase [Niastella]|uniref:Histidine kinase n=1 Tax=Niastella soli TaxID=2821487 RepID=A0ABS3Z3G5_9BACT|nr:histidine kinase [Niastella soli]MBO9204708.1 histidine kinase [Niastella soli]